MQIDRFRYLYKKDSPMAVEFGNTRMAPGMKVSLTMATSLDSVFLLHQKGLGWKESLKKISILARMPNMNLGSVSHLLSYLNQKMNSSII
jgi:hypothetical protein